MGAEQQLFLMEFLVDKVNIPSIRALRNEFLPVATCVSFQILNLPAVSIDEDTAVEHCACADKNARAFRRGKSCLFALPTIVLEKPVNTFPVTLSVYKKLPPDVLPDVMLIGSHRIEAKDLLNDLIKEQTFRANNPCRTMKDTYRITTATGQIIGEVTVFIRFSCFGKKIVTQFQIPHNRRPCLFKGADDSPIFQCKKVEKLETQDNAQQPTKQLPDKSYEERPLVRVREEPVEAKVRQCGCPVKASELL